MFDFSQVICSVDTHIYVYLISIHISVFRERDRDRETERGRYVDYLPVHAHPIIY
jgi:hypothetical protein